jgi:D,D-heptose 1,7-bisphosphate phosphatase
MSIFAVFFDRDGTLNEDPGYLGDPNLVKLLPGTGEALSLLKNELGFKLIVVSNQSGISRGLISKEMVDSVNNRINELLDDYSVSIDAFYYCPYHPDFSSREDTKCRKPSPEMVFQAAKKFNIDLKGSYIVGDSVSDIECGVNAGLKTILVKTGKGEDSFSVLKKQNKFPTFVAQNILEVSSIIKKDKMEKTN